MEPRQGELGPLLLDPVLPGDGVHAQPPLEDKPLTHLNSVLQVLGKISPAHHLQLARGIIGPQPLDLHGHFGHRRLVVLGVTHLGRLQDLHLQQAVIHAGTNEWEVPS
jgi:hypothetical protein